MRGSKGNKYYQSNKAQQKPENSHASIAHYYFNRFCSLGCFHSYLIANETAVFNITPEIERQTIGGDDAWAFKYESGYVDNGHSYNYFLINYLMGVRHPITREQAQTPDQIRQNYGWYTRGNSEAKPLAIQLGLAS
jgi:hypothetical protein